jgi:hypothetical protein
MREQHTSVIGVSRCDYTSPAERIWSSSHLVISSSLADCAIDKWRNDDQTTK